ncbi:MAG: ethanolamine utilization protein, partial [Azonexus sp.]
SSEEIEAALKAQNARPSLPPHLDAVIIDELPDAPGVYLFYGENSLPLYVSKAKDIRQRVLSHFSADHQSAREMALSQQVKRIDWIETAGEIGALLKEAALVKQLQPTHNRQLRKNDDACTWTLIDEGEGWLRPQLAAARDLDMSVRSSCYGLFKSSKEASEVLRALAAEHNLCDALLGLEKTTPGKPCFGYQVKRCKGACIGCEPYAKHTMRLVGALSRLKLVSWPLNGPALIREGDEAHLIDGWRYLGSARSDEELNTLLAAGRPQFERDTYKILAKYVAKMIPLTLARPPTTKE